MFRVLGEEAQLCDGLSRREMLRVGGLGIGGLTLTGLLRQPAAASSSRSFGKARSCILLYLVGGPPQHETWDPKPEASAEVRGAFGAIPSSIDGLQVGELMPRLARVANRFAVIRSMATDVNAHTGSGYWMLTGHPHRNRSGESIPPDPSDWPHLGAVTRRLLPRSGRLPSTITLPELVKNNPGIIVAGQNAGFMSVEHEPFLLECDPHAPNFQVPGLTPLPELPAARLDRRRGLLQQVNRALDAAQSRETFLKDNLISEQAFDLLTAGETRAAFDLGREPRALREKYGAHKWGQSCLLARRLVEAGVRLVTVNWPREPGDFSIGSPVWDTHADHNARIKDALMPPMDQGVAALIEDLETRGLLDETLVIWMGEFGRTPHFNKNGGRDHWGHVFPVALAGGGIRPGVVYGASDSRGAYPAADRVEPSALHATIYHCLGIPPDVEVTDRLERPFRACDGEPLQSVLL